MKRRYLYQTGSHQIHSKKCFHINQRPAGWKCFGAASAACVCVLALLLAGGCSHRHAGKLIVGMELAYPPFEMRDAQGNPTGVSPDLAQALGEYLHEPVTIENMNFSGLIPALKTGKIDLIISSMTETPERARIH